MRLAETRSGLERFLELLLRAKPASDPGVEPNSNEQSPVNHRKVYLPHESKPGTERAKGLWKEKQS